MITALGNGIRVITEPLAYYNSVAIGYLGKNRLNM